MNLYVAIYGCMGGSRGRGGGSYKHRLNTFYNIYYYNNYNIDG